MSSADPGSGGPTRINPFNIIGLARTLGQNSPLGPVSNALLLGITGTILAVAFGLIDLVQATLSFFSRPIFAGGAGGANIINSFLGGIANLINTGAIVSQQALGASPIVVPLFAFAYGIAVAAVGALIMGWILRRAATSDYVLGLATDFPFIGTDEEDDDD